MIDSSKHTQFWESLDRWHHVVQHMVRKGRAPRGITEEAYRQLRRDLMDQVEVGTADDLIPTDHLRHSLHRSVRPWVDLNSLEHCDKRVLRRLEQEVRLIRDQSMPPQYWRRQIFNRLGTTMIVVAALVIMIGLYSSGGLEGIWDYAQGVKAQLWHGVTSSSLNQRLTVLAASMVLIGMFFLRTPKAS